MSGLQDIRTHTDRQIREILQDVSEGKEMQHKQQIITKVKRLVKEIYLLKETKVTVKQLALEFKTTVRTIQRDLKDIKSIGLVIVKQHKNYEIPVDPTMQKYREQEIKRKEKPIKAKNEDKIAEVKETKYVSEITNNIGIIKKDKADNWFYYIKNQDNKITYISDNFQSRAKAKADLKLAL